MSSSGRKPSGRLKLTLDAAATPEHVRDVAALFADTIRRIDPALSEEGVTMVVENFTTKAELRGRTDAGRAAVGVLGELVQDPIEALQHHPDLTEAAHVVADRSEPLVPYTPRFFEGTKEIRKVDDVFVRAVRAAGQSVIKFAEGDPTGETITHSRILRIGRKEARRSLRVRIEMWGRPKDVDVDNAVAESKLWDLAKEGHIARLRVQGRWVRREQGLLELHDPRLTGLESTFVRWTGSELLTDAAEHVGAFSPHAFQQMITDLHRHQEDEP